MTKPSNPARCEATRIDRQRYPHFRLYAGAALLAGFTAAGVDVLLTRTHAHPAIAYLTRAWRLQAGVVISASHNPYHDNGIKFFSASGDKLPMTKRA